MAHDLDLCCYQMMQSTGVVPAGVNAMLPWIMLFSGTLCYIRDYSFLLESLAGKGYLVAIVDQHHSMDSLTIKPPGEPGLHCQGSVFASSKAQKFLTW